MQNMMNEVRNIFKREHINYSMLGEDLLVTGFGGMEEYERSNGDNNFKMLILADEDKSKLIFVVPELYRTSTNKGLVYEVLLSMQRQRNYLYYELNPENGEIRMYIELPIIDENQFEHEVIKMIKRILFNIDDIHPLIIQAINNGQVICQSEDDIIDLDLGWDINQTEKHSSEFIDGNEDSNSSMVSVSKSIH